jgi:hypothetical protein
MYTGYTRDQNRTNVQSLPQRPPRGYTDGGAKVVNYDGNPAIVLRMPSLTIII